MRYRALPLVLAFAATAVSAQVSQQDHSAHHPDGGAAPPAAAAGAPPAGPVGADRYAEQMKKMQDMHVRLQSAKTPAERRALMDEHLQLMQSGMDMMAQMGGRDGHGDGNGNGRRHGHGHAGRNRSRHARCAGCRRPAAPGRPAAPAWAAA